MKPINFPESNVILAEDQPEYQNLPVLSEEDGTVTSCWQLTWKEKFRVLFTGKIWITTLTFRNAFQPVLPRIEYPFSKAHSSKANDDQL